MRQKLAGRRSDMAVPVLTPLRGAGSQAPSTRQAKTGTRRTMWPVDDPVPYNPLDLLAIAYSVEAKLLDQEPQPLPPSEPFLGAGIYAIYYTGDFPAYESISYRTCDFPIYVGRAVPKGARKGLEGLGQPVGRVLYDRLRGHSSSIVAAQNLDLADFRCRFLVVEPFFVDLGERITIAHFRPVWNQAMDGFGNHDPGAGRRGGRRPDWDVLHPGRPWADRLAAGNSRSEILRRIEEHFIAPEESDELLDDELFDDE